MKNLAKIAAAVIIILITVFVFTSKSTTFEVTFENNCGETTTDFFLFFTNATTPHSVSNLAPNDTYVTTMKYEEEQVEDSLRLFYHDYNGNKNEIILIKSFRKGYKGELTIDIIDIDENGVYTIDIL